MTQVTVSLFTRVRNTTPVKSRFHFILAGTPQKLQFADLLSGAGMPQPVPAAPVEEPVASALDEQGVWVVFLILTKIIRMICENLSVGLFQKIKFWNFY